MEEQDQNRIDAEHADCHGKAETFEEFGAALQFALLNEPDIVRKVAQRRHRLGFAIDVAEDAAIELDRDRDVAGSVEPANLRRARTDTDIGDRAEVDASPAAGDPEIGDIVECCSIGRIKTHPDSKLALRQVEFGKEEE